MGKFDGPLENMTNICLNCEYLKDFLNGEVDVKQARENCALRCKQHDNQRKGIYKFDVVYSLYLTTTPDEKPTFKGRGRVSKSEERYGKAVRALKAEGKSITQIASILSISRPTVYKILNIKK